MAVGPATTPAAYSTTVLVHNALSILHNQCIIIIITYKIYANTSTSLHERDSHRHSIIWPTEFCQSVVSVYRRFSIAFLKQTCVHSRFCQIRYFLSTNNSKSALFVYIWNKRIFVIFFFFFTEFIRFDELQIILYTYVFYVEIF